VLAGGPVRAVEGDAAIPPEDADAIRARFPSTFGAPRVELIPADTAGSPGPRKVGVVLSGGQAPGGHNVLCGLRDGLESIDPGSVLIGFLDGPGGVLADRTRVLDAAVLAPYRNTGGFDCIGSGRDKIESPEQLERSARTCRDHGLDGLVVVGGDDSNTNAAVLAEHFAAHGVPTRVIGVPKTIDGDLKTEDVEQSFGFDTATKVYAELIGNIARDAASARKYWHVVKLMGRSASHVTLECALATRVNLALIGEEVARDRTTLDALVARIADVVVERSEAGRDYGVCLVPEGLIEFVPEMRALIAALNRALAGRGAEPGDAERAAVVRQTLDEDARRLFDGLPRGIRDQLLLDRDSHGNVQVSKIETEKLLVDQVGRELARRAGAGSYRGRFSAQTHFLGYEGRCAAPSNFDADYCYALGRTAALLLADGRTGMMAAVRGLAGSASEWRPVGVPIPALLNLEERKGARKPVIRKALVDLDGPVFAAFAAHRDRWATADAYAYPGAIQYWGPAEVAEARTQTLSIERG
jgi:pyrophosphate--fructose-6-phosphate 1-phosphotransferase